MSAPLVLSIFPGIGLLDMAFELEGFCVVRGPDLLWGGDIRAFHPPAGKFDGVIGGPPCQCFSPLMNVVRARGHKPSFGNLIPEFERVVSEAAPRWFLMENVLRAPSPCVLGWSVQSCILNNRWVGGVQNRQRRFSFGWQLEAGRSPRLLIIEEALEPARWEAAVTGSNGGRRMSPNPEGHGRQRRCEVSDLAKKRSFSELCELQGLKDFDVPGFTLAAKKQAVANGVPRPMGRAVARAVKKALEVANA